MRTWLLRGGVLAVLHAAAQTAVAAFTVRNPTSQTTLAAIVLGVLVGAAAVWGVLDNWRALPRPEVVWLIAALVAGWGAGVLGVIGRAIFVDQTGASELGSALTGGAAFTALLVFVPAVVGLLAGRWVRLPGRAQRDDETRSAPRA
jgi:phosphate/sulfate permease